MFISKKAIFKAIGDSIDALKDVESTIEKSVDHIFHTTETNKCETISLEGKQQNKRFKPMIFINFFILKLLEFIENAKKDDRIVAILNSI